MVRNMQEGMTTTWWRNTDGVMEIIMNARRIGRADWNTCPEIEGNAHTNFMKATIEGRRGIGSSAYCRAIKPYMDAFDISFYFWGVSYRCAQEAGYKAMQAHYNAPAPAFAWW